jgi:hypothetical protein
MQSNSRVTSKPPIAKCGVTGAGSESAGAGVLQPFPTCDEVRLGRLDEQVVMAAHQRLGRHSPARHPTGFAQGFQEKAAVCLVFDELACQEMLPDPFRRHSKQRRGIFPERPTGASRDSRDCNLRFLCGLPFKFLMELPALPRALRKKRQSASSLKSPHADGPAPWSKLKRFRAGLSRNVA